MEGNFKTEYVELFFKEDILYGIYQPAAITLEVAQRAVKQRLEFSNGNTYRVLIDIRKVKSVSPDARNYLSKQEAFDLMSVAAIVVNNIFQETIGNIFIYINRHPVKIRLFKNEEEAIKWLNIFK